MENNIQTSQTSEQAVKPGLISRVMMVFSEPSKLFGTLTGKTDWLIPFIIIAIVTGVVAYFTTPLIIESRFEALMDKFADNPQVLSYMEQAYEDEKANPFKWFYPLIWTIAPFIFLSIVSVIGLITGNFIFGGKSNFWLVFGVVTYAALIGLLGDAVRGILMLTKNSAYVYTGLGLLKPVDDGSVLYYLFSQVDLFSIWRVVVTGIGLGAIYRMSSEKFVYSLLIIWGLFIIIVALLNSYVLYGGIQY